MSDDTAPIVVEETYGVEPAVVWKAITDPEQMPKWFFEPIESFKPEVGFETEFTVHAEGKDYLHLWRVVEVVPNEKIAYTYNFGGYDTDGLVTWELAEVEGGTKLTLTHSGVSTYTADEPAFKREAGEAGWRYFLHERLKEFLEPAE